MIEPIDTTAIITGCGGDIGLSVGRILAEKHLFKETFGADISNDHAGLSAFKKCLLLPKASSENYVSELESLVRTTNAKWILPTSEAEIRVLLKKGLTSKIGEARVVLPNTRAMEIGFDKLHTARLLESAGLPFPWTEVVGEGSPKSIPCIVKSRTGAGSTDVTIAQKESVQWLESSRPGFIWQELLSGPEHEYTCCVFRSRSGITRSIAFRRILQGGFTKSGTVIENQAITDVLVRIADELELRGSINVQLRVTEKGPVVFEINPRFSSTLMFRHKLGFEDLVWSIQDAAGIELSTYSKPPADLKFYRTYGEYFVAPDGRPWKN